MGILAWIAFGLIAGAIAKFIMPGKDPGGCLGTVVIGILGAVIGGFVGSELLGIGSVTGFNVRSLGIAILGAIILLLLYRLFIERRPRRRCSPGRRGRRPQTRGAGEREGRFRAPVARLEGTSEGASSCAEGAACGDGRLR